jgi:DNA-binding PadR family transcriptional regulator
MTGRFKVSFNLFPIQRKTKVYYAITERGKAVVEQSIDYNSFRSKVLQDIEEYGASSANDVSNRIRSSGEATRIMCDKLTREGLLQLSGSDT